MNNKIDLHGIKHQDVQRHLDQFFWKMIQKGHSEVEIITGISERMKTIVKEVSKDYSFSVTDIPFNPGSLIVKLR